jgi:hypothetical protein
MRARSARKLGIDYNDIRQRNPDCSPSAPMAQI